jgi:hypothetical protein
MIKKSIFIFLLAIYMNGCAERGQSLNVPQTLVTVENTSSSNIEQQYALKMNASDSENDTLKNGLSGSLLLIIGLIILL